MPPNIYNLLIFPKERHLMKQRLWKAEAKFNCLKAGVSSHDQKVEQKANCEKQMNLIIYDDIPAKIHHFLLKKSTRYQSTLLETQVRMT